MTRKRAIKRRIGCLRSIPTAKKSCADKDVYFKKNLPTSQENAAIQQQTERTLDRSNRDLAREFEERRRQVEEQRAARDIETRTERMNLSRFPGLADDEDADPNPASQINRKVTWESDGLADWPTSKPPTADSWIEDELNGVLS